MLLGCAESIDVIHGDRESFEAFAEGFEVLEGEDGGRDEYGYLLAVGYGLEGGANGYFRFSKTHIATDQTVHRDGALHIFFDGFCRGQLVRGIFIQEARFEFVL